MVAGGKRVGSLIALALVLATTVGSLPTADAVRLRGPAPQLRAEAPDRSGPRRVTRPAGPSRLQLVLHHDRTRAVLAVPGRAVRTAHAAHVGVRHAIKKGLAHTGGAIKMHKIGMAVGLVSMGALGAAGVKYGFDGEEAAVRVSRAALGLAAAVALPGIVRAPGFRERIRQVISYIGVPAAIYLATVEVGHLVGNLAHDTTNLVIAFFAAMIIGADVGPVGLTAVETARKELRHTEEIHERD